jgi:hypothetical protein
MAQTERIGSIASVINEPDETNGLARQSDATPFQPARWLVFFGSGPVRYPAGDFIAVDAAAAIERAIEILGCAAGYRAKEIPLDSAPLPRMPAPYPRTGR